MRYKSELIFLFSGLCFRQVSHHPPISACHAESGNFVFWQGKVLVYLASVGFCNVTDLQVLIKIPGGPWTCALLHGSAPRGVLASHPLLITDTCLLHN